MMKRFVIDLSDGLRSGADLIAESFGIVPVLIIALCALVGVIV